MSAEYVALSVGVDVDVYGGVLWLGRREALQQIAVFVGTIVTAAGAVGLHAGGEPPTLSAALLLWARGMTWAVLGRRR